MKNQKIIILNKNKAIQFLSLEPEGAQAELKGDDKIEINYISTLDKVFELEMLSTSAGNHLIIWPEHVTECSVYINDKNIFDF